MTDHIFCSVNQIQALQARKRTAAPTCFCPSVWYFSAGCVLCVDIIASSNGGLMAGKQQVRRLTILNLLRVRGGLNSLSMTSGLRTHCTNTMFMKMGSRCQPSKHASGEHTTYRWHRQALVGTGRHWPEYRVAWCNEDDDADQHVHLTACSCEMSHILFSSGNLNSNMHADQYRHVVKWCCAYKYNTGLLWTCPKA